MKKMMKIMMFTATLLSVNAFAGPKNCKAGASYPVLTDSWGLRAAFCPDNSNSCQFLAPGTMVQIISVVDFGSWPVKHQVKVLIQGEPQAALQYDGAGHAVGCSIVPGNLQQGELWKEGMDHHVYQTEVPLACANQ